MGATDHIPTRYRIFILFRGSPLFVFLSILFLRIIELNSRNFVQMVGRRKIKSVDSPIFDTGGKWKEEERGVSEDALRKEHRLIHRRSAGRATASLSACSDLLEHRWNDETFDVTIRVRCSIQQRSRNIDRRIVNRVSEFIYIHEHSNRGK